MKHSVFLLLLAANFISFRNLISKDMNLLCLENGARIISFSSSDWGGYSTYFDKDNDPESSMYCSAEGEPFPHFIIYELAVTAEITSVEFNLQVEEIAFPGISAKDIRIWSQQTNSTEFDLVKEVSLKQVEDHQMFPIDPPFQTRRVKFEIVSNYGQKLYTEIAQIKALGHFLELTSKDSITGVWQTTFGELKIARSRPFVTGCYDGGALQGTFNNRVFSFYWTEREQRGIVSVILNEEGTELLGFWGGDEHNYEVWTGELMTRRVATCPEDPLTWQLDTVGETIIFNLQPERSRASETSSANAILNGAIRFLQTNPDKQLSVESFSDADSVSSADKALAELWALRVKNYFVENGIDDHRISFKGISEALPLADNESVTGRALNQRIRLRVLK